MRTLLALAMLLGCGGKKAADCKLEAEELYTLLKTTPHQASPFYPQQGLTLVFRTDLGVTPIAPGLVVSVMPTVLMFQGMTFGDTAALVDQVTKSRDNAPRMRDRTIKQVYLQLDKSTRWSQVVELAKAFEGAGFTIGFAFETGAKLTPPPRSPIDDKLDALMADKDAANKATKLATMAKDVVDGCPALAKSFSAVSSVEGEDKAEILIERTKEGLIDCNCKIDVPELRSMLWRVMAVEPAVQVVTYSSILRGDNKVATRATATWAEIGPKLPKVDSVQLTIDDN